MENLITRIFITFARINFPTYNTRLAETIKYSGHKQENSRVISGKVVLASLFFISLFAFLAFSYNTPDKFELVDGIQKLIGVSLANKKLLLFCSGLLLAMLTYFLTFYYYYYKSFQRTLFVENVLPDALFLIASNLKSGVTPFQAVKSSIRKEFGPLAEAFDVAINKSLGSKSFSNSLIETGDDINSELLRRSMRLFATAINSGSKISALLENMAKDIIERQTLKKELVTNTKTNSMFIMFMVAIGAPFLMAVSIFFVDSVSKIQGSTSIGSVPIEGMEGMGGTIQITIGFLMIYSYIFLFLTGFMASYFAGVMVEGDGRKGLNKAPIIVGASWVVFILAQYLIKVLLGGVF